MHFIDFLTSNQITDMMHSLLCQNGVSTVIEKDALPPCQHQGVWGSQTVGPLDYSTGLLNHWTGTPGTVKVTKWRGSLSACHHNTIIYPWDRKHIMQRERVNQDNCIHVHSCKYIYVCIVNLFYLQLCVGRSYMYIWLLYKLTIHNLKTPSRWTPFAFSCAYTHVYWVHCTSRPLELSVSYFEKGEIHLNVSGKVWLSPGVHTAMSF